MSRRFRFAAHALACTLALAAGTATADTGIRFDEMPRGCRWHTQISGRGVETSTYQGPRGGRHVVGVTDERGRPLHTVYYSGDGHFAERRWPDGRWERFAPHSCFVVPGRCDSTYERGDGLRVRQWSDVRRSGDRLRVRAGEVGGPDYADETVRLGPLNVIVESRNASYSSRVTRFEGCGGAGA